jgi:tetratricopeptide (TPR) repeat protein
MRAQFLAFAALVSSVPASAAWVRASSEHFLIYAEQRPETVRKFAENLERFDGAVRFIRGMDDPPLSEGNRVTIFVLKNVDEVRRLAQDKSGMIAGFYTGRVDGSVAFIPPMTAAKRQAPVGSRLADGETPTDELGGDVILLHEYSHHLMMQDIDRSYPTWLVEGFAEFMSTAQFNSDGTVRLGLPAGHRYWGLADVSGLPLETLLSGKLDKLTAEQVESVYGKGWLLTHYLTFEPSRKGQLKAYLAAIDKGADPLDAARQSFGDLRKLDSDIYQYLNRAQLPYIKIQGTALNFAPIQVSQLSDGGSAVVPLLYELESYVPDDQAEALATRVRAVEARFPGDELVETTLAGAELRAGHAVQAETAGDRALKANSRDAHAMVLKGRAMTLRASKLSGADRHALYDRARDLFIAANTIDREDPDPLYRFYETYVDEGIAPTVNAIAALHYASDLAPVDLEVRMNSALAYLTEGKSKEARRTLVPVAYYPHAADSSEIARTMIARIDAGDLKGALAAAQAKPENSKH